jgi:hypothetical protein
LIDSIVPTPNIERGSLKLYRFISYYSPTYLAYKTKSKFKLTISLEGYFEISRI